MSYDQYSGVTPVATHVADANHGSRNSICDLGATEPEIESIRGLFLLSAPLSAEILLMWA